MYFRSIPGFNGSEDCAALEQLLEGYDQQDQDQVSDVCNSPLFKYMDNDVSGPFGSTPFLLKRFSPCGLESFLPLYLYFSHQPMLIKEPTNLIELYLVWVMYLLYALRTAFLLPSCVVMCIL